MNGIKYRKPEELKDSGIGCLGQIPKDWKISAVKYFLETGRKGIRIGPFGSSLKLEYMRDTGYKVYGQENVIADNYSKGERFIDGEPITILTSFFPVSLEMGNDCDFSGSVYQILEDTGIRIDHAERSIEAVKAGNDESHLLGIQPGDALLLISSATRDITGRVVEYAQGLYRGDRYRYLLRVNRHQAESCI